jgi:hypothetical protein
LRKVKQFTLRYLSIILIFIFIFSSCQSTTDIIKEYKGNPCEDLQYLKLKKMKFSEMTGLESEYFKQKEKECNEFNEKVKTETSKTALIIVLGIGLVLTAGILLGTIKQH